MSDLESKLRALHDDACAEYQLNIMGQHMLMNAIRAAADLALEAAAGLEFTNPVSRDVVDMVSAYDAVEAFRAAIRNLCTRGGSTP